MAFTAYWDHWDHWDLEITPLNLLEGFYGVKSFIYLLLP